MDGPHRHGALAHRGGDPLDRAPPYRSRYPHSGTLRGVERRIALEPPAQRTGAPGLAPTGNHVTLPGLEIVRISDGKLVEGWEGYDSMTMMRQLGVM